MHVSLTAAFVSVPRVSIIFRARPKRNAFSVTWPLRSPCHFSVNTHGRQSFGLRPLTPFRSQRAQLLSATADARFRISDNVCPWCYVGKRNLESAMKDYSASSQEAPTFNVAWKPFFLDHTSPDTSAEPIVVSTCVPKAVHQPAHAFCSRWAALHFRELRTVQLLAAIMDDLISFRLVSWPQQLSSRHGGEATKSLA